MFKVFQKKLPDCNDLVIKFFAPWYPENERPKIARPDMYQIAAYKGKPLDLDEIQYLEVEYLEHQKVFIDEMSIAALQDFQNIGKSDKFDLKFLNAVDKYYDRKKIAELIKESDPKDFSNPYLVKVCEFGVMLGCLFKLVDGFDWLYSHPYFHSIIVHKESGFGITVFDWAIKKFSEYGVEDGFVAKFHAAIDGVAGKFKEE